MLDKAARHVEVQTLNGNRETTQPFNQLNNPGWHFHGSYGLENVPGKWAMGDKNHKANLHNNGGPL